MKKIFYIVWIALFVQCSQEQKNHDDNTAVDYSVAIDSARSLLQEVQRLNNIPGMSASVSINGEIVWSEGFGYADLENRVVVDPSKTMFRIGSVSKPLTATAMAILYEEGKLDLDKTIHDYLPEFPEKKYTFTVRQVGGHIAGIRHYRGQEMYNDKYYETVTEGLAIFKNDTLLFEPGTDYHYSSYGWNLISAVVEKASGQEFLSYMQQVVFDPLKLSNTHPEMASEKTENKSEFYLLKDSLIVEAPYVDHSYKWAGGGFISTSEDLVKFGSTYLLNDFLKQETIQEFTKSQVINDTTQTHYGIGWRSDILEDGRYYFGHSGGSVGGITQLVIYPESGVVVALVCNSSPVDYNGVQHAIGKLFSSGN
ncbi:MAG: beta-lactamase family protein [Cyclobacteriaceae bacterium]|nr:beta-lactamase family protein [Cyclobacteriaceae bacterium]